VCPVSSDALVGAATLHSPGCLCFFPHHNLKFKRQVEERKLTSFHQQPSPLASASLWSVWGHRLLNPLRQACSPCFQGKLDKQFQQLWTLVLCRILYFRKTVSNYTNMPRSRGSHTDCLKPTVQGSGAT
jgi:hypothetical protein